MKVIASLKSFSSVAPLTQKPFLCLKNKQAREIVLYKDDDIIALNKPCGLAVHAGPRLLNDLSCYRHFWQYEQDQLPQLAHRLDKATSGVLLLSRHKAAARWVAQLFHQQKIIKKYWVITVNVPTEMKGSIKTRLSVRNVASAGRHSMNRVVIGDDWTAGGRGQREFERRGLAWTEYKVLGVPEAVPRRCSLMELQAITGFKHQLRVHLADALNCPIFGDHQYGGPLFRQDPSLRRKVRSMKLESEHLYLHATSIEIPNYFGPGRPPLTIRAPLPDYFNQAIQLLNLSLPKKTL